MRKPLIIALATGLVAGLCWMVILSRPPALSLPPAMTAAELRAVPDARLVATAITDLRCKLQAAGVTSGVWRRWPEPARHLLAVSWVEGDVAPGTRPVFDGFAYLVANAGNELPGFEEVALALDVLAAPQAAQAARRAGVIAAEQGATPDAKAFAEVDRDFIKALRSSGIIPRLRAYVRDHVDDLVTAR